MQEAVSFLLACLPVLDQGGAPPRVAEHTGGSEEHRS